MSPAIPHPRARALARATAAALALGLAACAGETTAPQATAGPAAAATGPQAGMSAPIVQGQGLDFPAALAEAYATMASYEDRAGDAGDAAFFRTKAMAAASTPVPQPESAPTRELERARAALMLSMNARETLPEQLATAQAAYDCWANDVRVGTGITPIDCQALFRDTLRDIQARG
ncbi:hypothetical protein [Caenispirillum salinarum]|uniref:hypothetical protein n=1 Tax=Caenispirillum salinarum TaxID=859058 RepID=UPI0038517414